MSEDPKKRWLHGEVPMDLSENSGNIHVKLELGMGALACIVAFFGLLAVLGAILYYTGIQLATNTSRQRTLEDAALKLDRQYRMTELKLDDWTVVAHRSGLVLPSDYARGPQGNLDAEAFNLKGAK